MKKLLFLLLLVMACFYSGHTRLPHPATGKGDAYDFFSRSLPHAELEIQVLQSGLSQVNPNVSKFTGDTGPEMLLPAHHDNYLLALNEVIAGVHSKNYLIHNYPSHNFW